MSKPAVTRLFATSVVLILLAFLAAANQATAGTSSGRACTVPPAAATPKIEEPVEPEPTAPPPVVKLGPEVVGTTLTVEVSGYTSEPGQTDSRPCEAADQSNICERKHRGELICAASRNFPLGTRVHIDGLGTCTVADRMNPRYTNHLDWYFGQDPEGDDTRYRRAMKIARRNRVVTIVSIPK